MRFVVLPSIILHYAQTLLRVTSVWARSRYHTQHDQYIHQLLLSLEVYALFKRTVSWFYERVDRCQELNSRCYLINRTFNIHVYIVPMWKIILQHMVRICRDVALPQILNVARYTVFCRHNLQGFFMENNAKWQKKCLLTQLTLKKCELPLLTVKN